MLTCYTRIDNISHVIYVDCYNNSGDIKYLTLEIYDIDNNLKVTDFKFSVLDFVSVWNNILPNVDMYDFINGYKIIIRNDITKEIEHTDIILNKSYMKTKFIYDDNLFKKELIIAFYYNLLENFKRFKNDELNIKNDSVLVDLGSSVGLFTSYAIEQNPNLKSICVEMSSNFYKVCVDTFKNNPNVIPINAAIYKSSGETIKIHARSEDLCDLGNTIVGNIYRDQPVTIEINTISLEEIIKTYNLDRISLLKVDIEGYEYELFENLTDDILDKIDKILLEFHPVDDPKRKLDLINRLMMKGFKMRSYDGDIDFYNTQMFTLFFLK